MSQLQPADTSQFPVLVAVLDRYLVKSDSAERFVALYHRYGESRSEFDGLAEELREAIKHPKIATPVVNEALGLSHQPAEMRVQLSDLLDQLLQQGEYSADALEQDDSAPTPDEVMDYWLLRRVTIPIGSLRDKPVPLWMLLVGGMAVFLVGLGIGALPLPGVFTWLSMLLQVVGVLVILVVGVGMLTLRREITRPQSEEPAEEPSQPGRRFLSRWRR